MTGRIGSCGNYETIVLNLVSERKTATWKRTAGQTTVREEQSPEKSRSEKVAGKKQLLGRKSRPKKVDRKEQLPGKRSRTKKQQPGWHSRTKKSAARRKNNQQRDAGKAIRYIGFL